ncbi:MAG: DUF805 domain-containing protein [Novosphingobium sp.]|nr:DUF805 domain-containing protein [Novosphingobium sp.]
MEWMFLPYKRYVDFSGRSRRLEFWMFILLFAIVYLVLFSIILSQVPWAAFRQTGFGRYTYTGGAAAPPGPLLWLTLLAFGLFVIGSFIPLVAVYVRRFHDRNMSGWFFLLFFVLGLIPYINFVSGIVLIVLMCLEGTRGPNRYGPDPLDPTSAQVFA